MDETFQLHQAPSGIDDDYERAAEWLDILADGKLDELTQRRFSLWFNGSERRREIFQRMSETWSDFTLNDAAQDHLKSISTPVKKKPSSLHFFKTPQIALSLCLGVCIGVVSVYFFNTNHPIGADVVMSDLLTTDFSQAKSFQLNDGSNIELSPTTHIKVAYSTARRDLSLEKGSALFQVAHDKSRPFDVRVGDVSVIAVGTQFVIDKSAKGADVVVYEGVVEVRKNLHADPVRLAAGSSAHIENNIVTVDKIDGARLDDWRSGWLEIKSQSFAFLVEHLNRNSTKPIVIEGDDLKALRIAGRFKLDNSEKALTMLSNLYSLDVQPKNDRIIVRQK